MIKTTLSSWQKYVQNCPKEVYQMCVRKTLTEATINRIVVKTFEEIDSFSKLILFKTEKKREICFSKCF